MEQAPRNSSPKFYRRASIAFFLIALFLTVMAIVCHDWVYGAFAVITFLNAVMTTLKVVSLQETKQ
ncbi:MAG TPA: hypothetical protein VFB79_10080 [Candidatus Angelobacter sp.]|nr:hypothetical protein [Candidatus Angelobacter sp.]